VTPGKAGIEARREAILAHETETARTIAARVVDKPVLSVWMILLPLTLLYYMQRHQTFKQGVAAVSEELLRTKRRALDLACRAPSAGGAIEAEEDERVRAVRAAEAVEVDLLAGHYRRLLEAEGADYPALVREAYGTPDAYGEFLQRLEEAERAVTRAAHRASGDSEDLAQLVERLERALSEVRAQQAGAIFA
jgi:hypothetical protein